MSEERAVIKNVTRAQQIHSFTDLKRKRNISPTDIDGLTDYGGKAFIYMEGKVIGKELEPGQRLALEAVVSSHWQAGHPSMALVYEHDIPASQKVPVAFMFVRGVYTLKPIPFLTGRRWQNTNWYFPQTETIKVVKAFDYFEEHFRVFQ